MGQSASLLASKAGKPPSGEQRACKLQSQYGKFRILIMGRANSGKTTILQRTCKTTGNPVVYNPQGKKMDSDVLKPSALHGIHDIENEMIFKSNTGFCFHDSHGFESDGIEELEQVKTFIANHSKETDLSQQVHVIWYCIPVDDSHPFTAAESRFFSEHATRNVPVIVIFTKFDALDNRAFGILIDKGEPVEEAHQENTNWLLDSL